ncbi:DNA polymerase III subunit alpha [Clavibacter phaseoli]|uniref:DNA polymerase III subunit alpha n=4 Tax=Clavibacter phaseoli TaxID=1734031 RepID=UPI001EEEDEB3|nr:DNA polymerase III subunit alpha [Clavibacter phaseoli]UKF30677.1 DNA polymerase III subunit alpha [Clavibacter phaseoli]UKF36595.1 DNA polymerase III subunit alpha [Clavibacter phaseoli]
MSFTHLHVASAFSAHFGTSAPEALVDRVASEGAPAAAITDRDGLYGAVRHIRRSIAQGVSPVVGAELGLTGEHPGRITVLAHGGTRGQGWAALSRLISASHGRGTARSTARSAQAGIARSRPPAFLLGEEGPVGTVMLGPDSDVGRAVAAGDHALASRHLAEWARLLPGAVVVEVVCHFTEPGESASLRHAARMLELADAHRVPAVLTNAVRYLEPDDALTGDVLDAAGTLRPLGSFRPQPNGQAWLKTPAEMQEIAREIAGTSALDRRAGEALLRATEELADRCRLDPDADLAWRKPKLPEKSVIGVTGDPDEALWRKAEAGVTERFGHVDESMRQRVLARMRTELQTITGFGFATYFLTVADVCALMRDMGVRNQARGSGAGSLVNYLLRISNVDPLEHDLLFERFLGKVRSTLPDIDIDVESARRHEVYHRVFEKYGSNRVTLLSMQNTYRARGAARDAGLALDLDEQQIDFIAKNIWRFNAREFRAVLETKPELKPIADLVRDDPSIDLLVDLTERLDRLPRHISMHPCGVILGDSDLLSTSPVQPSGMGLPMSQFDKDDIDDMGLLKLDILGVRMQSTMAYALEEIHRIHGTRSAVAGGVPVDARYVHRDGRIELDEIPHDDEETFAAIRTTHTLGMFQIESPGQRELIGKMQPDVYEDLIADISLFRPGPMKGNMVAPFLDTKHGITRPDYLHPRFAPFLAPTFGVVIYHEQVIRIFADCMQVSLAEADELRRNMERMDTVVEAAFRERTALHVDGRTGRRPFSDADVERIWKALKGFGSFGFCKAHGAAFALPTWQSAWLKTHYPAEFLAGILTHDPGMYPKRLLLTEARRMGVPVLPLDVNRSTGVYRVERVEGEGTTGRTRIGELGIRLSLQDVHGMSQAELERIERGQPYDSISDFYAKAQPSRALLERLAAVGALDSLATDEADRAARGAASRGDVMAFARRLTARAARPADPAGQLPLFVDDRDLIPRGSPDPDGRARVAAELDILQMEVTEHVLESYRPMLDELGVIPASQLLEVRSGSEVVVAGIRIATQTPPMRSGKRVVFISLDDGTGCSDSTFFDEAQQKAGPMLFGTRLLVIRGRTRRTGERGVSIQAEDAWDLKEMWARWQDARRQGGGGADGMDDAAQVA